MEHVICFPSHCSRLSCNIITVEILVWWTLLKWKVGNNSRLIDPINFPAISILKFRLIDHKQNHVRRACTNYHQLHTEGWNNGSTILRSYWFINDYDTHQKLIHDYVYLEPALRTALLASARWWMWVWYLSNMHYHYVCAQTSLEPASYILLCTCVAMYRRVQQTWVGLVV